MFLSDMSIKRPVFITMVMIAFVVVGLIAYNRLPVDLFPDMSSPVISVRTQYSGAGPTVIENEVTKPIEDAVSRLPGVKSVESTSSEGSSSIRIEYELDYPIDRAVREVSEQLSSVKRRLPSDAEEPILFRFDPSTAPFLMFSVADNTGSMRPDQLRSFVDNEIMPRIERVEGVASVDIGGGLQREIQVLLSLDRLQALGVSPQQVSSAIKTENVEMPGGSITEGGRVLSLRTPGSFQRPEDVGEVVVVNRGGIPILVKDVATVTDGFRERRNYTRLDGESSVSVQVRKQSGTNTLKVAAQTNQVVEAIITERPNLTIVVTRDESQFIKSATEDTMRDLVIGALLACLVVFLFFLNWRMTVITIIGLPVIVVGTFWAIMLFGFTLNMITLLALSLCIGLLIDDAIVVRENMFRHLEMGETPVKAASRGTAEIALAVLAMTLSIVSVFLPVAFATGMIGKLFRQFGITVSIAVFISLFEAFTLAPMLASRFDPRSTSKGNGRAQSSERSLSEGLSLRPVLNFYRRVLSWTLTHRVLTIIVVIVVFALSLGLLRFVGQSLSAESDQGYFEILLRQPPGMTLEKANTVAREAERRIMPEPEVAHLLARVNAEETTLSVRLKRRGYVREMQQRLRRSLANLDPDTTIRFSGQSASLTGSLTGAVTVRQRPILLSVQSNGSLSDLEAAAMQVRDIVASVPGVTDPDVSLKPLKPAISVSLERARAAEMGLSTTAVGATVRSLINGDVASQYREGGQDIDIVVRLREEDRQRTRDILELPLLSSRGGTVQLGAIADVVPATEPVEISRLDRQRQVLVGASFTGRPQGDVIADIRNGLQSLRLPAGVSVKFTGQTQQMQESFNSLYFVMALAVVFMYMVLASQLGSFVQPLIVMLALPLAAVGAIAALLVTRKYLDITAMIGMILLMGIVTKNSILLLDFANVRRRQGATPKQAMLEAGQIRLRPVLMTSAALIMGMLPVAIGLGAGSEFRSPMAITVIGGLLTSTALTLVVVPVIYTMVVGRSGSPATIEDTGLDGEIGEKAGKSG